MIKTAKRQGIPLVYWLIWLFLASVTLMVMGNAYAQTGNPPRGAGYVLGNKYYFTANQNEESFKSCPVRRVTSSQECKTVTTGRFRAHVYYTLPREQRGSYGHSIYGSWTHSVTGARAECSSLLARVPSSAESSSCGHATETERVCDTIYSQGSCISINTACAENSTLCGYIDDHLNWFNKPPIADDVELISKENLSGQVTVTAIDPDGPTPTIFEVFEQSEHGTAVIEGDTLTFTPNENWFGSTTLTYRAQDNKEAWSEPATVTVTVTERKLVLADGADAFTYVDATRQGKIQLQGIDEKPMSAVVYLKNQDGATVFETNTKKTELTPSSASFGYNVVSAPSGTYTLEVEATDSLGHTYQFVYGEITIYILKTLDFAYDPVSRDGQVVFEDKGNILSSVFVQLLNSKGAVAYQIAPSCKKSQGINTCDFNLNGAPEGEYEAKLELIDNFDFDFSTQHGYLLIDKTPADISHSVPKDGLVQYVSDIHFKVHDQYDPDVTITAITLFNDESGKELPLEWSKDQEHIALEHFSIFPSEGTEKNYHIKIETIDHQLNKSDLTVDFYYQPKTFFNETLNVPALLHVFTRPDGSPAIRTEKIRLANGDVIKGQHTIVASLERHAEYPVKINGFLVEPGKTVTVASNYNFDRENGQLKLPVEAVSDQETVSDLLLTVATPGSPVGLFKMNFWTPAAKIESSAWSFRQVIDPISMVARSTKNSLCAITANEQVARRADPFDQSYCLVEWNQLPDEVTPYTRSENGLQHAALEGQAVEVGTQKINYDLYIYNGKGEKVHVENGEYDVEIESAFGAMALDALLPEDPVFKLIDELDIRFKQVEGKTCAFTVDKEQATRSSSLGIREHSLTCYFEWKETPPEVKQLDWLKQPQARGIVPESGTYDLKWELSIFSQKGKKVLLADQNEQVEVVDPPAPEITLESKYLLEDEKTVVLPINENYIGDVFIKGQRTNMDIEIVRNSDVLYDETIQAGFGGYHNTVQRQLNEDRDNRSLWGESIFTVKSTYEIMPDLFDEKHYSVYSSPVTGAKPFISSPDEFALNTSALPIHVDILDQYSHRDPYDAALMGEWEVRIMRILQKGELEPMSEYTSMEDGHAEFEVDISNIDDVRTLRFTAEARLIHSVDGYERIEESPRVLLLSLLRGDEIDADITSRTLSGPAPLRGSFKIDLKERDMQAAAGDIVWELSLDGGASWEEHVPDERYKFIYNNEFDTGTYHLRANITNRYSGLSKYTETIEIIAYDKPELRIEGPTVRFVGDEVTLTAIPGYESRVDGEKEFTPIHLDETVIEWSTDNGRTYDQTGSTLHLSSDTQQRIMVAARVRTDHAPEEDRYAFNVKKTSVEFKPIRELRVRVTGPSLVEVGKEYEFEAVTSLPYRGMDDNVLGYFMLPNGEQVDGPTLIYTPTDEDLEGGRMAISYHAWIEGYEDQGTDATHTLRSSIWKYIWPDFAMHYQANAPYAPSLITMTIRPMQAVGNRLEDVRYEWSLPKQIEMVDNSRDIIRKFNVLEAGEHMVRVVITDARGHEAVVEHPISLEKAIPYTLDLDLSPSNQGYREPLTLVVRPRISGGHPRDRFESFDFTIDGQPVESLSRYTKIEDLEKGTYEVVVKMTSQMGVITEESTSVEVFENQVPICTVSERESSSSFRFTADCTDPDGRMSGYDWQLGDRELVSGSKSITVGKHHLEGVSQITLVGIDDSGGRSEPIVIPIHYSAQTEGTTAQSNE